MNINVNRGPGSEFPIGKNVIIKRQEPPKQEQKEALAQASDTASAKTMKTAFKLNLSALPKNEETPQEAVSVSKPAEKTSRLVRTFSSKNLNTNKVITNKPVASTTIEYTRKIETETVKDLHAAQKASKAFASIEIKNPKAEEAHKAANALISQGAKKEISSAEYLKSARSLQEFQRDNPIISTTMLNLYEFAAQKAGNFDQAMTIRDEGANAVKFSKDHPAHNMNKSIAAGTKRQANPDFGSIYSNVGTSHLVEGSFTLRGRTIAEGENEGKFNCLVCHIDDMSRESLEGNLQEIQKMGGKYTLPGGGTITLREKNFCYLGKNNEGKFSESEGATVSLGHELVFEDAKGKLIGKMSVGSEPETKMSYQSLHANVAAEGNKGENLHQLQQMFSLLGLGGMMGVSRPEDVERNKIALIVDSHFPALADELKDRKEFYQLSPTDLKELVIAKNPAMSKIFEKYDEAGHLQDLEVLPGKVMPHLMDISSDMEREGKAAGLVAGVGSFEALMHILNGGFVSTEVRFESGILGKTTSAGEDGQLGGSNTIFNRIATLETMKQKITPKEYTPAKVDSNGKKVEGKFDNPFGEGEDADLAWLFHGKVQVLSNLSVCNRGARCYYEDNYGVSNKYFADKEFKGRNNAYGLYKSRDGILTFAKKVGTGVKDVNTLDGTRNKGILMDKNGKVQTNSIHNGLNEVCVSGGCMQPKDFACLKVQTQEIKDELIAHMMQSKLVKLSHLKYENDKVVDGTLTFGNGAFKVQLSDFISVGYEYKPENFQSKVNK